jgi:hypothetical protein
MSEGPECQQAHAPRTTLRLPKHDSKITFYNQNGEEVGILDFTGRALMFEGNIEASAMEFLESVGKMLTQRMKDEYKRGMIEGKKLAIKLDTL